MPASRAARMTATPASGVIRSNVRHEPSARRETERPLVPRLRTVGGMPDLVTSDGGGQ